MKKTEAILAQIKKYNKIIIHRHQRPDPDAIGSQVGLSNIIADSFPTKQVFVVGKDIPDFDWIGQMDDIESSEFNDALVIVIDTANTPRIDDRRFNNGDALVKIDHHPNDDMFGDVFWVDPDASSCSEMVYRFYDEFKDQLKLSKKAASALYAGIIGDTGRFLYPATTPATLRTAAALMEAGADAATISRLEDQINLKQARLSAYVLSNLAIDPSGAAHVTLSKELLKKLNLTEAETSNVVPLPGQINTVKAWAIFVEQDDGHFRIRLRSKGPAINGLAKDHNGGGHELASGAKAKDEAEIKQVISELTKLCASSPAIK